MKFFIHKVGTGFRKISLVRKQAASAKAARAADLMYILGPFGVQLTIRLFRFGFKHTNNFLYREKGKISLDFYPIDRQFIMCILRILENRVQSDLKVKIPLDTHKDSVTHSSSVKILPP